MSAAKINNVKLTFFMDSLLEIFNPNQQSRNPIRHFSLSAAPEQESKAQRATRQAQHKNVFLHLFSLTPYRMIFVARANTSGGIVKPICLSVLRLITNSN